MQILKSIFCTWQGWSEIVIPSIGAIVIPLLIVWLTWYFGSSRAEKIAEKQQNESKLIYLRSLLLHAIKDFLMFRNNIMSKIDRLKHYQTCTSIDKKHLFAAIAYYDIYSKFEPQDYATLSTNCHNFIVDLLQAKTYILHVYAKFDFFNKSLESGHTNIHNLLSAMQDNLPNLQLDIDDALKSMTAVLADIDDLEKSLKFKLIHLELESFEKEELRQALAEAERFKFPIPPNTSNQG